MSAVNVSDFILNDGSKMPAVGLGLFQGYGDESKFQAEIAAGVRTALDAGYRHFDSAFLYVGSEAGLGEALRDKLADGNIKREDLFITTKLWSTDHKREHVVPALRTSLKRLKLDYVDNYLIHCPCAMPNSCRQIDNCDFQKCGDAPFPRDENGAVLWADDTVSLTETWQGMEECLRLGLTKSIGVSNFNQRQLQLVLDSCTVRPSNHQIESNPFFTNRALVDFCQSEGITVVAYSPMGKPHRPWAKSDDPVVFTDPTLVAIGKKYNKTAAQIALKFQVQRGVAVVPKSSNPERQRQNIELFDFTLTDEDIQSIFENCDKHKRCQPIIAFAESKEYPFKDELQ